MSLNTLSIFDLTILQAFIAATISHGLKMPIWWTFIHLIFTPALIITLAFYLSPIWFFAAFLLLALIYGKTYQTQVPLSLTSHEAANALASLLPDNHTFSLIDLGCGCGGLLAQLSKAQPNGYYFGIEAAPIPFIMGKLRTITSRSNCLIKWGDLWKHDLASYNVVYAYLSPVPMLSLWRKACKEMRPGNIFISNSFIIPGIKPEQSIKLDDFTGSILYVWRISAE